MSAPSIYHEGKRYLPPARSTTARALGTLEESTSTTGSIGSGSQISGRGSKVGSLKGHRARLAGVTSVGVLEKLGRATDSLSAGVALLGGEPLGVEWESEDQLVGGEAEGEILVDGTSGALDRDMVGGVVVATVHEIVGHDLEELAY